MSNKPFNLKEVFDTMEREFQSVKSKVQSSNNELASTKQTFAEISNQIIQSGQSLSMMNMQLTQLKQQNEQTNQTLKKLIAAIPPEHQARANMEMEKADALMKGVVPNPAAMAQMAAAMGMPPGMLAGLSQMGPGGMQGGMAAQQMAMNQAAMAAAMFQGGQGMVHQHALMALQQQANQQHALRQMHMMQAMGMPPTSMAGMGGPMPTPSLPSPARFNPLAITTPTGSTPAPASPFATPQSVNPSSATMARSRKRSSPATPRAGDTPPVPTSAPALSNPASRSVSPSAASTHSAPAAPSTTSMPPLLAEVKQEAAGSPLAPFGSLPPDMIAQMMAQPGMAGLLHNFLGAQGMGVPSS